MEQQLQDAPRQAAPPSATVPEIERGKKMSGRSIISITAFPFAILFALGIHRWATGSADAAAAQFLGDAFGFHWFVLRTGETAALIDHVPLYTRFLGNLFYVSLLLVVGQAFWRGLRHWLCNMGPILAVGVHLLCIWEILTAGTQVLKLPYFPSPAGVLHALISDGPQLWESTWHSLLLLLKGYVIGSIVGVITGVCIGWFPAARYWGMPVLKVVGPIPATAWIPLTMVVLSSKFSAMVLIAIAVWFPVTMLTASGISNTKASYLDVARTLGASRAYLIFRVAIPAAMPNIFIGLFMGLGASFLTLLAAESVGVKSGLGWYIEWARGWAEYGKVFAALVIMAAFFSTIMTLLFKIRDRVLVWQKGVIKW